MQLIVFTKELKSLSPDELVSFAARAGLDGVDLAVRPGYPVNPENVREALPRVADLFRKHGLDIPMITGNFDLLTPAHPTAKPILEAMRRAGVRLLKLGYWAIGDREFDYWAEVEQIRQALAGWEEMGRQFGVTVCCHTHSERYHGETAGMMAHLVRGFDPAHIGVYIDPGHLCVEGEDMHVAARVLRGHICLLALKDFLLWREPAPHGHGRKAHRCVPSGEGMVDWTAAFRALRAVGYEGPGSIHFEFKADDPFKAVSAEVVFFRRLLDATGYSRPQGRAS